MFGRTLLAGAAMMIVAMPVAAQERGTVEFGGFGSYTMFDNAIGLENALGAGARIGAYLDPRWALEFAGSGGQADLTAGGGTRNFSVISARVVYTLVKMDRLSFHVGGGVDHSDHQGILDSYGYNAILGAKMAFGKRAAMRGDYTYNFLSGDRGNNGSFQIGLALYRSPEGETRTLHTNTTTRAPYRADSVSAAETARLRAEAARYAALRDSLARNRNAPMTSSNVAALATMLEMVHFEHESAELDNLAKAILRDKVAIFNANPDMKIVITGYASSPGTDAYNMALGLRRAHASKDYLVSQGVAENRIEIATRGENNLLVEGPGEVANAENRRGQFRLLIADPNFRRQ